jgi:hypothetical protein
MIATVPARRMVAAEKRGARRERLGVTTIAFTVTT